MTGTRRRLTGRIQVALPPGEAFRLFTPRGEQDWAHGWHPRFPAPAPDDTEPGTVFETSAHGRHATWLVTGREPGKRITYARVTPGEQAGTVTVTVSPAGQHSEVEVTYELTALTSLAERKLTEFADGYPAYLQSWQDAIAAWLHGVTAGSAAHHDWGELSLLSRNSGQCGSPEHDHEGLSVLPRLKLFTTPEPFMIFTPSRWKWGRTRLAGLTGIRRWAGGRWRRFLAPF